MWFYQCRVCLPYRRRCFLKQVITMPVPRKVASLKGVVSGFTLRGCSDPKPDEPTKGGDKYVKKIYVHVNTNMCKKLCCCPESWLGNGIFRPNKSTRIGANTQGYMYQNKTFDVNLSDSRYCALPHSSGHRLESNQKILSAVYSRNHYTSGQAIPL